MGLKKFFKKKLMLGSMKKQRAGTPFDVKAAELFELTDQTDPNFNNSYYITAHGDARLYLRLGKRADGKAEIWLKFTDGEFTATGKTVGCALSDSPVTVGCIEPAAKWEHVFRGEVTADGEDMPAEIKVTFFGTSTIYDFFTHGNDALTAKAYTGVKWNGAFFDSLKRNKQTHYEQVGFADVEVAAGGTIRKFSRIPAVRDHSFGMRDWSGMRRHFWFVGASESGEYFNVSSVHYPCADEIRAGYFCDGGGFVNFDDFTVCGDVICGGNGPDEIKVTVIGTDGRKTEISGRRTDDEVFYMQGGSYVVHEGLGEFIADGKIYKGIWEFGFNADPKKR